MNRYCIGLLFLSGFSMASNLLAQEIQVETSFPGGSAEVESIDQTRRIIKLTPTPHPGKGFVCWWYAKVTGLTPGESLTLDVGNAPWATPDQAVMSVDKTTWIQTAPGSREGKRIRYTFDAPAKDFWVAWGTPYLLEDAQRTVAKAAQHQFALPFELCQTRGGRTTPALSITEADSHPNRIGIWIQARQHAWESGSSWVCDGLIEWIVSDAPEARELRQKTLITIVPIMDIDNVEIGAGGKNQIPQDHNRDWSDSPHWKAVAAAQRMILDQDQKGQFDIFVDLHNPGANDKYPYFYVPPKDQLTDLGQQNLSDFLLLAKKTITGPLTYRGRFIESGAKYDPKAWMFMSKNWVAVHTQPHVVAVTLETAWNTPHSTVKNYQQVGAELGKTIHAYLQSPRRSPAEK